MTDVLQGILRRYLTALLVPLLLSASLASAELSLQPLEPTRPGRVSLAVRGADLAEVMEMLSRKERVNILLADGVDGQVSVNLYDVDLDEAIKSIAKPAAAAIDLIASSRSTS